MTIDVYEKAHYLRSKIRQLERLKQEVSNGYRYDLVSDSFKLIIDLELSKLEKEFNEL